MSTRVAAARNLLKVWLVFAVPAAALGFVGWRLGDYRLALLFAGSFFLLGAVLYWYAERIGMGMVGARELAARRGAGAPRDGRLRSRSAPASSRRGST